MEASRGRHDLARSGRPRRPLSGTEGLTAGLEIFVGVGAIGGGGLLSLAPDGHLLGMTTKMLAGTPFDSYLVPGLLLFTCIGVFPIVAAVLTLRRMAIAPFLAIGVGVTLLGWISVEMVMLAGAASLAWAFYLVLGSCIGTLGAVWLRASLAATR